MYWPSHGCGRKRGIKSVKERPGHTCLLVSTNISEWRQGRGMENVGQLSCQYIVIEVTDGGKVGIWEVSDSCHVSKW